MIHSAAGLLRRAERCRHFADQLDLCADLVALALLDLDLLGRERPSLIRHRRFTFSFCCAAAGTHLTVSTLQAVKRKSKLH